MFSPTETYFEHRVYDKEKATEKEVGACALPPSILILETPGKAHREPGFGAREGQRKAGGGRGWATPPEPPWLLGGRRPGQGPRQQSESSFARRPELGYTRAAHTQGGVCVCV